MPGGVPVPEVVAVGQPSLNDPDPDPLMDDALNCLSDLIWLRGILTFESLELVNSALTSEATLHRRMQAEWRDCLDWHRGRHDLGSHSSTIG